MTPTALPTLDQLAADPAKAQTLPPEVRQALTLRVAAVLAALASAPVQNGQPAAPAEPDRLLTVKEVAARLRRSPDHVYRRAWPFEVRGVGRGRRFSAQGFDRYLRQRQGR